MELLKVDKTPATFKWQGVTFFYRKHVTVEDKFSVDTSGKVFNGNKIEFKPWEFYKTMIRVFVVGWESVTENGKPIDYSYENLMTRLPANKTEDLVMLLGHHIAIETGFLEDKKADDLKNEHGGRSNG